MVAAGECYGPRCMAENTPPWPCWYPLARFSRVHTTRRWGSQSQTNRERPCSSGDMQAGRLSRRSFSSLDLFFFFFLSRLLPLSFLFLSSPSGNPASLEQFLHSLSSMNPNFSLSYGLFLFLSRYKENNCGWTFTVSFVIRLVIFLIVFFL